jgi:hypothetical protein
MRRMPNKGQLADYVSALLSDKTLFADLIEKYGKKVAYISIVDGKGNQLCIISKSFKSIEDAVQYLIDLKDQKVDTTGVDYGRGDATLNYFNKVFYKNN